MVFRLGTVPPIGKKKNGFPDQALCLPACVSYGQNDSAHNFAEKKNTRVIENPSYANTAGVQNYHLYN